MHTHFSIHTDHNHDGLFSRFAHELSAALDWLSGPPMSEQDRRDRVVAEVQNLKYDTSALHLQ